MAPFSKNSLLLRGARIITPDRVIEQGAVLIEAGRIEKVFKAEPHPLPPADAVFDLEGFTLFPGFIDVHIHGATGVDMMRADTENLLRVAEFLARHGVTAWLPTLVPSGQEQYAQAIEAIDGLIGKQAPSPTSSDAPAARALGVHYEGPFVNNQQCGALHHEHFRTFKQPTDLEALPRVRSDSAVHLMTLAPEVESGIELIKELRRRSWVVSIGHTRATPVILDDALEAGARHMTHFMNAMTPLHHRTPGPVAWGLLNDEVTCDVIADGVHLDPMILKLVLRSKTADRVTLISDAIAATGLGNGEFEIWGEKISVTNGRTANSNGNIAGSVITMLDAVRMMLALGASEIEVARMASTNPARLLRIEKDYGSIEIGKRADLVCLDRQSQVRLTVIDGLATMHEDNLK